MQGCGVHFGPEDLRGLKNFYDNANGSLINDVPDWKMSCSSLISIGPLDLAPPNIHLGFVSKSKKICLQNYFFLS